MTPGQRLRPSSDLGLGRFQDLGEIIFAHRVISSRPDPRRTRNIILLLAGCVALMMTGFGIIMPVFARRLGELGSGVEALGLMTVAFAVSQFISSPIMGALADRLGRKPLILLALVAFSLTNIGYLLVQTTWAFILVRALGGALTAGLFPSAMGVVADLVPEERRARWIGIVMGGYGAGFILGPVVGGLLYDAFGFAAPFILSAIMSIIALIAASLLIPETRPASVRRRDALRARRVSDLRPQDRASLSASLPRPLHIFITLLLVDFSIAFAFAFVEPQMVFFMYDDLGWSTAQFGLVVGVYGLAMVFGQAGLGQLSDRWGRKPVIIGGILLNTSLYAGLFLVNSFAAMIPVAFTAAMGAALTAPALSAFYLDITAEQHRSLVLGIKGSALSLGGVLGPLSVVFISQATTPKGVFAIAWGLTTFTALLAAVLLKEEQREPQAPPDMAWDISQQRNMAAQASLRGIVLNARAARTGKP